MEPTKPGWKITYVKRPHGSTDVYLAFNGQLLGLVASVRLEVAAKDGVMVLHLSQVLLADYYEIETLSEEEFGRQGQMNAGEEVDPIL